MGEEAPVVGEPAMQEDVAEAAARSRRWPRSPPAGAGRASWPRTSRASCPPAGNGSRSRAAARPGSWPSPTRRPARRPGTARPTRSPRPRCRWAGRYDRVLVLSRSGTTTEIVQLLDRLRGTAPTVAITAVARHPGAGRPPTPSSTWASRTRNRWCRPGSPPPSWSCSARTWAQDPGPAADAAERVLAEPLPAGDAGRPPVHLPRHRLDLRPGQRGRAQAARGGRACGPRPTRPWSTGTARSR